MREINNFIKTIEDNELVEPGDTIIIGASGGPDSQFLIYLFNEIKKSYDLKLILAHLNHLHRKEAIVDENLVIATAKNLGLEYRVKKASMDDFAKDYGYSPEEAGRILRYDFFSEIAKDYPNAKIAIAHNKDDQAETLLMRIIRGTGLDGLGGMAYKNGNIIRPILDFSKKDILSFLEGKDIDYVIDKTNLETDYTRNYIRHEIIPKMEVLNPMLLESLFSLSILAKNDSIILNEAIEDKYQELKISENPDFIDFDREKFEDLTYPYQARLLRFAINKLDIPLKDIGKANIDDLLKLIKLDTGRKLVLGDVEFTKNYKTYRLGKEKNKDFSDDTYELFPGDEIKFLNLTIKTDIVNERERGDKNVGYFALDKLNFPLTVRTRRNGDRFIPKGFNHNKKLKDFFIDNKVDKAIRDQIPIILSNNDIIWVAGFREASGYVESNDNKYLKIEVLND